MVMHVVMYGVTTNCISSAVALNSVASLTKLTNNLVQEQKDQAH